MPSPETPLSVDKKIPRTFLRLFLRILLGILGSGLILALGIFAYLYFSTPQLPSYTEVVQAHRPSDSVLLDRQGQELHRLRVNFQVRQGDWVKSADLSPALVNALLTTEDKRFYQHHGVDVKAVAAAMWSQVARSYSRGASTLTMQLVGMLDPRIAPSGKRSLWQKMQQATAALALEQEWTKDEILEAYLNIAPFRGELVGISAFSQSVLGKHPNGINSREAALTVALLRSPNASVQKVAKRACQILENMQASDAASECPLLEDFAYVHFSQPLLAASSGIAPHLAQQLFKPSTASVGPLPLSIQTTLDAGVQRTALASLRQHLRNLSTHNIEDGGVIVIDNKTGEIRVWVGSSGDTLSQAAEVDTVTALRQPGSTLKPFLFGQAIEKRYLTAASLLHDFPINLNVGGGLYVPQNYDRKYKGWVSVRTALASSLNIPTVRVIVMLGANQFANNLLSFGLPLKETGEYYGYSLALGSAEVSLLTLTNAYRALYNGGVVSSAYWISPTENQQTAQGSVNLPPFAALNIEEHQTMIGEQTAWIISSILSDRHARVTTFGLDSVLNTRYWSAVKTGTSKDMRDNWTVGYSAPYTVGVWVGNASGAPMWGVSGTSGATPVWQEVMNYLYEQDLAAGRAQLWAAPPPPAKLVQTEIHFTPTLEPNRVEWFIEGTEQNHIVLQQAATGSTLESSDYLGRILSPVSGSILALDPDIPPENQRMALTSNRNDVIWKIKDLTLGKGAKTNWQPIPGRHYIILTDENNQELDRIHIEVRGASVITPPKKVLPNRKKQKE